MERDKLVQETQDLAVKITEYLKYFLQKVLVKLLKSELIATKEKLDGKEELK